MGVSVDGHLYVCHRFNKHNTHHIPHDEKYGHMGDVENGITNFDLWNRFNSWDVNEIEHCKDCKLRYICKGGCYASNYDTAGAIDGKVAAACRFQEENHELAKIIIKRFKEEGLYDGRQKRLVYEGPKQSNRPAIKSRSM